MSNAIDKYWWIKKQRRRGKEAGNGGDRPGNGRAKHLMGRVNDLHRYRPL